MSFFRLMKDKLYPAFFFLTFILLVCPALAYGAGREIQNPCCVGRMADGVSLRDGVGDSAQDSVPQHESFRKKVKKTGNFLRRFIQGFNDFDTTYITPNYYNYTAMVQNTNYFQMYQFVGETADKSIKQTISTKPAPNVKVGPYFGWKWLFVGYTFDVSHPQTAGKQSELNLSLYSSQLGVDFVYMKNSGDYKLRKATGFDGVEPKSVKGKTFSGINAHVLSANVYYVFNHRKFSYPAAYNQSTVQRVSCGSGIMGAGYSRQKVSFDYTKLPSELVGEPGDEKIIDELKYSRIDYSYYYLSGGYAYNWVFARNWLLGVSAMPSIGLRKTKGEKIRGDEILLDLKTLSLDCTSRIGLVWNNTHWFVGASYISHIYAFSRERMRVTNFVNYLNIYVGFFFHKKKQYR